MTLDELIALGERCKCGPGDWCDWETACTSRLLPILKAAKQMRDVLANEMGMDDCPDAIDAIKAFDEAVNK